jgi:peptidoglycan/LPS O-acetylase OafA/YrhL
MISIGHNFSEINMWASPINNYFWFFIGIMFAHFKIFTKDKKILFETVESPLVFDALTLAGLLYIPWVDEMLVALILFFLVLVASFKNTVLGKICRSRILGLFGMSCYSIYFLHFYAILIVKPFLSNGFGIANIFNNLLPELQYLIFTFVVAIFSLVLGLVSFMFIEKPSVRLGVKFIDKLNSFV